MTSALSTHRDHLPPQPSPQEAGSRLRVWSPRATGVYTAEVFLTPSPHGGAVGGVSSLFSASLLSRTPQTRHTWSPHQPICISKKIHSICFRFIYTSTRHGGAESRAPCLPKPPTPIGGLQSMCPLQGLRTAPAQATQHWEDHGKGTVCTCHGPTHWSPLKDGFVSMTGGGPGLTAA